VNDPWHESNSPWGPVKQIPRGKFRSEHARGVCTPFPLPKLIFTRSAGRAFGLGAAAGMTGATNPRVETKAAMLNSIGNFESGSICRVLQI
jgi:hypothetical protein